MVTVKDGERFLPVSPSKLHHLLLRLLCRATRTPVVTLKFDEGWPNPRGRVNHLHRLPRAALAVSSMNSDHQLGKQRESDLHSQRLVRLPVTKQPADCPGREGHSALWSGGEVRAIHKLEVSHGLWH